MPLIKASWASAVDSGPCRFAPFGADPTLARPTRRWPGRLGAGPAGSTLAMGALIDEALVP